MEVYVIYKTATGKPFSFLAADIGEDQRAAHIATIPGYSLSSNSLDLDAADPTTIKKIIVENGRASIEGAAPLYNQDLQDLRDLRDRLLAETDWWAVADRTMTDEQRTYRQALRDLPQQYSGLSVAAIPAKP